MGQPSDRTYHHGLSEVMDVRLGLAQPFMDNFCSYEKEKKKKSGDNHFIIVHVRHQKCNFI